LRVRWALEEIGRSYDTELLNARSPRPDEYLARQPFDQVPAFRDGDLNLFETGAILLYLGEQDRVGPRPYVDEDVVAVGVGDGALLGAVEEDVDADEGLSAGVVGHAPGDLALAEGGRSRQERQEDAQCDTGRARGT
jgi:hypothetical protein